MFMEKIKGYRIRDLQTSKALPQFFSFYNLIKGSNVQLIREDTNKLVQCSSVSFYPQYEVAEKFLPTNS